MERVSPSTTVASSLPAPPTTFYANDSPRNWTVSIISRGLMVGESGCKEIRTVLKQEMEKRHLIGGSLSAPQKQTRLDEVFKELEARFPLVFTTDIPRQWLDSCELGMARKINYTYTHACNRKRQNSRRTPSDENTDPRTRPCTFNRASFYIQSKRTMVDTLFSPVDIVKSQRPDEVVVNDIDFGMFKELLKEDNVYDAMRDRIMCRIGNRDIEINHSRKFKAAALSMYERGQDPIYFVVEGCPAGECVSFNYLNILAYMSEGRAPRANRGVISTRRTRRET